MFKFLLIIFFFLTSYVHANILQKAVDDAPSYSVLKLSSGIYKGNIIITKPIIIIGKEEGVIIEGSSEGNVITIKSSHVKLENLKITKSGMRRELLDSAIFVNNAKEVEIQKCVIEDSHLGIFLDNVTHSKILNNKVVSPDNNIDLRGDGLRLWYSHNNSIKNNSFIKSRDIVLMHSNDNTVANNYMQDCRYSVFSSHSNNSIVQNNEIKNSSVGIYIAGSLGSKITNNTIKGSLGSATSMGILLQGASDTTVKENSIGQCNQALYIDKSPMKRDTKNWILDNKIMFSTRGLDFRGSSYRNVIKRNELFGNMDNIMTDSYTGRTNENEITGNYWDDYEGFDLDMDNIGDTSYKKYLYFDQIWIKHPEARFFYGSPIVSILNFMLKIAPFVEPIFLMEDKEPKFKIEK